MIRVDRTAWTNHKLPPSARLLLAGSDAGDMRVSRERMTDKNRIIVAKRSTALFVDDFDFFQNAARLELKPPLGKFEFYLLLFYYTYTFIHITNIIP